MEILGRRSAAAPTAVALALAIWPVAAQRPAASRIAIIGGRILTVTRGTLEPGVVLIDGGRIADVRAGERAPDGYEVIDARRQVVMPGLVDAHSHIGMQTPPRTPANFEMAENTDPFTPAVRVADSIDVEDPSIGVARAMGITTAVVFPAAAISSAASASSSRRGRSGRAAARERPAGPQDGARHKPEVGIRDQRPLAEDPDGDGIDDP